KPKPDVGNPATRPAPAASTAAAAPAPVVTPPGVRVKASPLAKKLAASRGIDLSRVAGSGPGGRIVKADVLASQPSATAQTASSAIAPAVAAPATPAGPNDQRIPLSG